MQRSLATTGRDRPTDLARQIIAAPSTVKEFLCPLLHTVLLLKSCNAVA